jgi:uncharacterized protein
MKSMYLTNDVKNCIVKFLINKIKPQIIYLFGSFAKGEGREDSDVDLAIYTDEAVSPYDLFIMSNQLSFEVKRDVQIVNLKEIDTVFAAQIIGNREELYCSNELLRDNFNVRVFKNYVKLNEERKIIIDAIERDGRIYG